MEPSHRITGGFRPHPPVLWFPSCPGHLSPDALGQSSRGSWYLVSEKPYHKERQLQELLGRSSEAEIAGCQCPPLLCLVPGPPASLLGSLETLSLPVPWGYSQGLMTAQVHLICQTPHSK
jgi:hypothetical protein